MNKQIDQEMITRMIREAIDGAFIKDGLEKGIPEEITRQELEESRQMADRFDDLLIAGYTEEQIEMLWKDKTPQEILAEADGNGVAPREKSEPLMLHKTP